VREVRRADQHPAAKRVVEPGLVQRRGEPFHALDVAPQDERQPGAGQGGQGLVAVEDPVGERGDGACVCIRYVGWVAGREFGSWSRVGRGRFKPLSTSNHTQTHVRTNGHHHPERRLVGHLVEVDAAKDLLCLGPHKVHRLCACA
jgi:hypothetical protein